MIKNSYALKFFIIIELVLGLDFLFPNLISNTLRNGLTDFMPLYLWAFLFIIFSISGYFSTKLRYYILFVSVPLSLFAANVVESVVLYNQFMGLNGMTTYILIALGSIIIAARVFRKDE